MAVLFTARSADLDRRRYIGGLFWSNNMAPSIFHYKHFKLFDNLITTAAAFMIEEIQKCTVRQNTVILVLPAIVVLKPTLVSWG